MLESSSIELATKTKADWSFEFRLLHGALFSKLHYSSKIRNSKNLYFLKKKKLVCTHKISRLVSQKNILSFSYCETLIQLITSLYHARIYCASNLD